MIPKKACGLCFARVLCFAQSMRTYQLVQMTFWILPLCLQPLIALVMIVRRQVTDFPVFFLYTLFVAGRDLALFFLRSHMRRYSWIYWVGEPLSIILGLAAICEVVWRLIQPYPTLRFLGVRLFWMTFIITFLAGVLMLNPSQFVRTTIQIVGTLGAIYTSWNLGRIHFVHLTLGPHLETLCGRNSSWLWNRGRSSTCFG